MDEKTRRIAQLKAEIAERQAELVRLSLEYAAELAGLSGDEKERFVTVGLHNNTESGTLGTQMSTVDVSWGAAIAKARRKAKWPFQRALDKAGKSLPEWARERGANVENAKSWLKQPGKGGRPVPRDWAKTIAKEFPSVPAVDKSWPNGIRD